MPKTPLRRASRATTISVCSGKGGVGKSTIALLLASRLAESGRRTLLIDADFGTGDLATMTNVAPAVGFEDLLIGNERIKDATLKINPYLWVVGTIAGKYFDSSAVTPAGLANCAKIESDFDVVLIDTPATLEPFILSLIGGSDLAIAVTTSRIPAIADTYIQLKQLAKQRSRARLSFIVNRVESQVEGDQTIAKFGELMEKFMHLSIPTLGMIEDDPQLENAAENQSLLALTRQSRGAGKKAEKIVKVLVENYIGRTNDDRSVWSFLADKKSLKNVAAYDDRVLVVQT